MNVSIRGRKSLVIVLLSLLLVGCASNNGDDTNTTGETETGGTPQTPNGMTGLQRDLSISIENQQRDYHLFLPEFPSSANIVLLLHGRGGSKDQMLGLTGRPAPYKVWLDIAERENLILIVPDGVQSPDGRQGWNDCRSDAADNPDSDDVMFLTSLVSSVVDEYVQTSSRVFVNGTSNGAHMSMRLADEAPALFSGFAFIVGQRALNSECTVNDLPVPVLFMLGTEDPLVPYNGGQVASDRGLVLSAADTVDYWRNRNELAALGDEFEFPDINTNDDSTVRRFSYRDDGNPNSVVWIEVLNGGHTEPSIDERLTELFKLVVGEQNGDIEMAEEVWRFFNTSF